MVVPMDLESAAAVRGRNSMTRLLGRASPPTPFLMMEKLCRQSLSL